MKINEYGWIVSANRVAHSGGGEPNQGYLPCGYMSCALTAEQAEWAFANLKELESLKGLSHDGYSIDGDLLNQHIVGMGKVSI